METGYLLPLSQAPATSPYPESEESSSFPLIPLLEVPFQY